MKTILVTGGFGFIGINFVQLLLKESYDVIVVDKLTYAAELNYKKANFLSRITFYKGDICDKNLIEKVLDDHDVSIVVNFAAESHVDRSIFSAKEFVQSNIVGTQNLLDVCKEKWAIDKDKNGYPIYKSDVKFVQISTDEVYGSIDKGLFTEESPLDPKSPYSASKASADLLCLAYNHTFHFPVCVTRCSNNYGPYQYPEKLIPLMIQKITSGEKLPVYGDGKNVRDWIYVDDHCAAILLVLKKGELGEVYNVGTNTEIENLELVKLLISQLRKKTKRSHISEDLISYVPDRLGHDKRYAIDSSKIRQLGWTPIISFKDGVANTINWYVQDE